MSTEATLIFPHQLFEKNPALKRGQQIYLIEEFLFFKQYRFHKQKLIFHRASMKSYEQFLVQKGYEVTYIESNEDRSDIRAIFEILSVDKIHVLDPVDDYLSKRIRYACKKFEMTLALYDSPGFLNTKDELADFFKSSKKKFYQTAFYKEQRKTRGILLDNQGEPLGGKWTFDSENRKKYPAKKNPPEISFPSSDATYRGAVKYVEKHFPDNPGMVAEQPLYPYNHQSSRTWFQQFLENRFAEFGDYEDAILESHKYLNHSILSPIINVGLLTPEYVVGEVLNYSDSHMISLNNTEGIVRQIVGWREFIRGVYEVKGAEERTRNFWNFSRKIPKSFYSGTTGIHPVDITIKKLLETGYNHHIERLMILGNFMLLCEFDPDEVYRWFMEMYVDAYDWVMVPNVYGMSQFADGGLMSTKPYISSSNYLMKMSDFHKGDWQKIWDGLFWRFMHVHREFFLSNPRMGMLIKTFDKMDEDKRMSHLSTAENYLESLA